FDAPGQALSLAWLRNVSVFHKENVIRRLAPAGGQGVLSDLQVEIFQGTPNTFGNLKLGQLFAGQATAVRAPVEKLQQGHFLPMAYTTDDVRDAVAIKT